jgi:hypothetical protein
MFAAASIGAPDAQSIVETLHNAILGFALLATTRSPDHFFWLPPASHFNFATAISKVGGWLHPRCVNV